MRVTTTLIGLIAFAADEDLKKTGADAPLAKASELASELGLTDCGG